jgi:hypothetical protein
MRVHLPEDWDDGLNFLSDCLEKAATRWDAYEIDYVTALRELQIIASDARPFSGHSGEQWRSTIDDLRRAKPWVGRRLMALLESADKSFIEGF